MDVVMGIKIPGIFFQNHNKKITLNNQTMNSQMKQSEQNRNRIESNQAESSECENETTGKMTNNN
jgi:hypothetical protein